MLWTASVITKNSQICQVINRLWALGSRPLWRNQSPAAKPDLYHFRSPQVVQVNNPFEIAVFIYDHKRRYFSLFHNRQSRGREFFTADSFRISGHTFASEQIQRVLAAAFEQAAQIAVTDNAEQFLAIHDR